MCIIYHINLLFTFGENEEKKAPPVGTGGVCLNALLIK